MTPPVSNDFKLDRETIWANTTLLDNQPNSSGVKYELASQLRSMQRAIAESLGLSQGAVSGYFSPHVDHDGTAICLALT
jgi:hypothetical protein